MTSATAELTLYEIRNLKNKVDVLEDKFSRTEIDLLKRIKRLEKAVDGIFASASKLRGNYDCN